MISQFRAAVAGLLRSQNLADVYEFIPEAANAYPCIVVGRVSAAPSDLAGTVFDLNLDVYVCGRAQSDDAQEELDKVADQVWAIFGGTKSRTHMGIVLTVIQVVPSVVTLAGDQNIPTYAITVESSALTC